MKNPPRGGSLATTTPMPPRCWPLISMSLSAPTRVSGGLMARTLARVSRKTTTRQLAGTPLVFSAKDTGTVLKKIAHETAGEHFTWSCGHSRCGCCRPPPTTDDDPSRRSAPARPTPSLGRREDHWQRAPSSGPCPPGTDQQARQEC